MTTHSTEQAYHLMRHETGVVIPVYFPEGVDIGQGKELLRETARSFCRQVAEPDRICLSVDGDRNGAEIAEAVAREFQISWCLSPVNRGKLQGAATGVRFLLKHAPLQYVTVADQDGDHFANELLNFLRAAVHISAHTGTEDLLILGRRISRHRPMGFLRGEIEELANRVLLDALHYRAVIAQQPLRLEYAAAFEEYPDVHSGYKLFSRSTAEAVFLSPPQLAGVSEDCYYRHACEAVMFVEALEHGAYLGVVNRSTFNEQPMTTFGLLNRVHLAADKMIWPCKRLKIPVHFVEQWLANHLSRLLLNTLAPEGREELEQIRRLVITTLAGAPDIQVNASFHPLFI